MTAEPLFAVGDAEIDGAYRYELTRCWGPGPVLTWIMLNPSVADGETSDPTITRLHRRALRWQWRGIPYGSIRVLNLFAWRATSPAVLLALPPAVATGPDNDRWLATAEPPLVAAWGADGSHAGRATAVLDLLAGVPLLCLGTTAKGEPKHPLYVPYSAPLIPYRRAA